ncbi:S1 RNA-binding domain-containing protein [Clostridia bacterium OttesenSCG-928-F22]|nr:S1 RNA-binding domain-containing protein [Clostridia bacterium OttesenSCG-928-F22]
MSFAQGTIVDGKVNGITKFGAFIQLDAEHTGMVHISEVAEGFVKDINEHLKLGDVVRVKVLSIDGEKIALSIKKAQPPAPRPVTVPERKPSAPIGGFEDMMLKFMKDSDERQTDIRRNTRNKRGGYSRGKNS